MNFFETRLKNAYLGNLGFPEIHLVCSAAQELKTNAAIPDSQSHLKGLPQAA